MAEAIEGFSVVARILGTLINTIDGDRQASCEQGANITPSVRLTNGTGANQANRAWGDGGRTLLSGATENIDLYDLGAIDIGAGAGKSALGQAVALTEIVGLLIYIAPASVGQLKIGGEGSVAAWNSLFDGSDTARTGGFGKDGIFLVYNPVSPAFAVADASNHLLKVEAVGGDVTYSLYLLGRG